ncbi:transmembrane protein 272 isoform X2 [Callithrix jacchus]
MKFPAGSPNSEGSAIFPQLPGRSAAPQRAPGTLQGREREKESVRQGLGAPGEEEPHRVSPGHRVPRGAECCLVLDPTGRSSELEERGRTMPGGLEKACHECISKIASNACFVFVLCTFLALPLSMAFIGVSPVVRLHQDEATAVQGRGDR